MIVVTTSTLDGIISHHHMVAMVYPIWLQPTMIHSCAVRRTPLLNGCVVGICLRFFSGEYFGGIFEINFILANYYRMNDFSEEDRKMNFLFYGKNRNNK